MDTSPSPGATLRQARDWLRARIDEGERCPCCTQMAKVYRRTINRQMVTSLIALYQAAGTGFGHWPTILGRKQADEAKLRYWGLIEEAPEVRPDGGRAGWWRVTAEGRAFLLGDMHVPKYARIYDGRCLGLDNSEVIDVHDALGRHFDLTELMAS